MFNNCSSERPGPSRGGKGSGAGGGRTSTGFCWPPIGTGRPVLLLLVGRKALGVLTEVSARPALDDIRKAGGDPEGLRLFQAVLLIEVLDISTGFGVRELVPATRGRARKSDPRRWERSPRNNTPGNGGSSWGHRSSNRGQP